MLPPVAFSVLVFRGLSLSRVSWHIVSVIRLAILFNFDNFGFYLHGIVILQRLEAGGWLHCISLIARRTVFDLPSRVYGRSFFIFIHPFFAHTILHFVFRSERCAVYLVTPGVRSCIPGDEVGTTTVSHAVGMTYDPYPVLRRPLVDDIDTILDDSYPWLPRRVGSVPSIIARYHFD